METQLRTASLKPVVIPVATAPGATASTSAFASAQREATVATLGLAAAQEAENTALSRGAVLLDRTTIAATEDAAAQQLAGVSKAQAAVSARELTRTQTQAANAAHALAVAQGEVVGAASAVTSAQVTLTRSTAAVAAAERALGAALEAKNIALIDAASQSVRLAQAQALEAETALTAARAQSAHAASLGAVRKAGFAGAASMLGLRGAVLTAGTAFLAATVGITAFTKAVQSAADLEEELNVFQVTAGATADEMERVAAAATNLGRDLTLPGVTAQDAAVAMTTLSKAGLDVQESIDGARGALSLAVAAQTDFANAADLIANSLNAFRLNGRDAGDVANLLAASSNEAQGSIEDMGLALKQAAAVAQLAGINIEDTLTILTQLAKAGLAGSDAGTSFRTALVRLIKPTKDVNDALALLGVRLRDSTTGAIRPEVFGEIGEALKEIAPAQRQFIVAQLGGSDAVRAFGLAAQAGVAGFQEMNDAITGTTAATDLAAARTKGFSGDVENLSNQVSSLGTTIGQIAIPPLSIFARTTAAVAGEINDTIISVRGLVTEVAGLGKPFADAVPVIEKTGVSLEDVARTAVKFQLFGPVLGAASIALDKFGDSAEDAAGKTGILDGIIDSVTASLGGLTAALGRVQGSGQNQAEGLNVQQVLNRVTGFDSAETRARIRGSTEELLSVLQEEQAFLEGQLERDFVKRRPGLQRQLENALFGVVNDIGSIASTGAADAKRAATDAARAVKEADQALLDLLSNRRDDAGRRIAAAAETEGVADDIRRQDQLQALIKQQIQKVRDRISDEKTRKAAIRELRIALIASRAEEDALRRQQKEDALQQRATGLELDIDLADINENDARRVALRRRRIAQLRREAKLLNLEGNALKENRNERARIRKEIEEILKEDKDKGDRKTAQQVLFEGLQAQQGFAANLLGNLIPRDQTAGLVGTPSPSGGIKVAASVQEGKAGGGPSSGQASTTNDLLRNILQQLKVLNGSNAAPEATRQRQKANSIMDGGGGNVEAM